MRPVRVLPSALKIGDNQDHRGGSDEGHRLLFPLPSTADIAVLQRPADIPRIADRLAGYRYGNG